MSARKFRESMSLKREKSIISQSDDNEEQPEDPFGYEDEPQQKLSSMSFGSSNKLAIKINPFLQTKIVAELIESIQPNTWYNIPPPVVKSITSLCEIIKVLEKRFLDTNSLQTEKQSKQTNNIRKLEKALHDKEQNLNRSIESVQRLLTDKILKLNSDANLKIELAEARFEELTAKVQRDRELVDTRLSRIDDSIVIKKWVENLFVTHKFEINNRVDHVENYSKKAIEKIYLENLTIPGYVGNKEKFQNLRDYISNQHEAVQKSFIDLETRTVNYFHRDVQKLSVNTQLELGKLREFMNLEFTNSKLKQQEFQDKSKLELDDKLQQVIDNLEKVEKSLDTDIFEAHERIDQISKTLESDDWMKKFEKKFDDLNKMKEQINYEIKQSEQRTRKKLDDSNKEFQTRIKKQIDQISKVRESSFALSQPKKSNADDKTSSYSPRNPSTKQSISPKPVQVGQTNLDKAKNDSKERRNTILLSQQERLSQLQEYAARTKDSSQDSNPKAQKLLKKDLSKMPKHFVDEIEKLIDAKLNKFKPQEPQSINFKANSQSRYSKKASESLSMQEGQNFMIGFQAQKNQNFLTNRQSDKISIKSLNNQVENTVQGLNLRKQFLSTQQNFSQHVQKNKSVNKSSQLNLDKNRYNSNYGIGSYHLPQTEEQLQEESQQKLIFTPQNHNHQQSLEFQESLHQSEKINKSTDKVSFIKGNSKNVFSDKNKSSGLQTGTNKSKVQQNQEALQDSFEMLQNEFYQSFDKINPNQTQNNQQIDSLQNQVKSRQSSHEAKRPQSKNRDQFMNFTQNNARTIQKYEQDVKNTFRIPPILGNSTNTNRQRVNLASSLHGLNNGIAFGDQSSRNTINQSVSIDNSATNRIINNIQYQNGILVNNNYSNRRNDLNRSYNLTMNSSSDYPVKDVKFEGVQLTTYEWPTQQNVKALLYFLPAYGDYCQNYGGFFKPFAQAGIRVLAMDRRGFGLSQGKRGQISERLYEDQWNHVDQGTFLRGFQQNIPKFIIGHSQGALIATRMLQQRPGFFTGCILLSPFYDFSHKIGTLQLAKIKAQSMIKQSLVIDLKNNKDQEMGELFKYLSESDKFTYYRWQAQNVLALLYDQEQVQENMKSIDTPTLMIIGGKDSNTNPQLQKDTFEKIPIQDKKLIEYKDDDHFLLWYDGVQQKVQEDSLKWLQSRFK
eukprot:403359202